MDILRSDETDPPCSDSLSSSTFSQSTENAQSIMPNSSTTPSCLRALSYEVVASRQAQDGSKFSQEKSWMNEGPDSDLAGTWSWRRDGKNSFELPTGKRDGPDEYHDSIESRALGKGKGKAVDSLQNYRLKALAFGAEDPDTDMFYEYSSGEEDNDGSLFSEDFYDPVGEHPLDQQSSFLLADHFLKTFNQSFTTPSSNSECPKFVAGPSRITLDDLNRDSLSRSSRWQ